MPAYTFPATANVVALAGATPVLVDVDPVTMNLDPSSLRRAVTPRTKAVLAVHLFGRPARVEELPELPMLEDAAGALGAHARGRPCGGLGLLGCFSFHPRKIVTTGEGGAVDERRRARGARALAPASRLVAVRRIRRHARGRVQLPAERRPLRARHPAAAAARGAARRARAGRGRLRGAARRAAGRAARAPTRATATAGRPT